MTSNSMQPFESSFVNGAYEEDGEERRHTTASEGYKTDSLLPFGHWSSLLRHFKKHPSSPWVTGKFVAASMSRTVRQPASSAPSTGGITHRSDRRHSFTTVSESLRHDPPHLKPVLLDLKKNMRKLQTFISFQMNQQHNIQTD